MNGAEIMNFLLSHDYTKDGFASIYSHEKLPELKGHDDRFVIIHANDHWTAAYFPTGSPVEYFDPLANPPLPDVRRFLEYGGRRYVRNYKKIQGDRSTACASFCLSYIYARTTGTDMDAFVNIFGEDPIDNDLIVSDVFETLNK